MKKLEIKNPDGSHYWTEHFNTKQELDKWLAEEMTRPYWKEDFEIVESDFGITEAEKEELDLALESAINAQKQKKNSAINKLKALGLTEEEIEAIVK